MLPVPLLKPSLEVLRELALNYRTSIVLCTATQPALSTSETFKDGLEGIREIIPDPAILYKSFKRVSAVKLPLLSDEELAARLNGYRQVLCIVNTRKHARLLYEHLRNRQEGSHHLSALMCPAHRTEALNRIRAALANGRSLPGDQHATGGGRCRYRLPRSLPVDLRRGFHCSGRWPLQPGRKTDG